MIDWNKYYEKDACIKEIKENSPRIKEREEFIYELFPNNVNSVLDVGCGDGYLTIKLIELKYAKIIFGVDLSYTRMKRAKAQSKNSNFCVASSYSLPYKANSFDLVLCTEVLEHLEDFYIAFSEILRVAKKYILITVPNNEPTNKVLCPNCLQEFYHDGHLHSFNSKDLQELFQGMQIIKLKESIRLKFFLARKYFLFTLPYWTGMNWHLYHLALAFSNRLLTIEERANHHLGILAKKN